MRNTIAGGKATRSDAAERAGQRSRPLLRTCAALVAVAAFGSVAGCGDGGGSGDRIAGSWQLRQSSQYQGDWTLSEGKVEITETDEGVTCSGTYQLDGEDVTIDLSCSDGGLGNSEGYDDRITGTVTDDDHIEVSLSDGGTSGTLVREGASAASAESAQSEPSSDPDPTSETAPTTASTTTQTVPPTVPSTTAPAITPEELELDRWSTPELTMQGVLDAWAKGELPKLGHLDVDGTFDLLTEIDPATAEYDGGLKCMRYDSKVGGVEAGCEFDLSEDSGLTSFYSASLFPSSDGNYWTVTIWEPELAGGA